MRFKWQHSMELLNLKNVQMNDIMDSEIFLHI